MKLELGSRPWRNSEAEKAWIEAEKKKAAALKEKKEKEELEKSTKEEAARLVREEIVETGRSRAVETAQARLAQLREDVARLEAKRAGVTDEKWAEKREQEEEVKIAELAAKMAEERQNVVAEEVEKKAASMLEEKEKEIAEKRKKFDEEQKVLAETRRKQLLDYKFSLGLESPSLRQAFGVDSRRPSEGAAQEKIYSRDRTRVYDDVRFWKLSEDDQHLLESLEVEEQIKLGFGPYEATAQEIARMKAETLKRGPGPFGRTSAAEKFRRRLPGQYFEEDEKEAEKNKNPLLHRTGEPEFDPFQMQDFLCVTTDHAPGFEIQHIFGPLTGSVFTETPPPSHLLTAREMKMIRDELDRDRRFARSDVIKHALELGANALLALKFDQVPSVYEGIIQTVATATAVFLAPLTASQQRAQQMHDPFASLHRDPPNPYGDPFGLDMHSRQRDPRAAGRVTDPQGYLRRSLDPYAQQNDVYGQHPFHPEGVDPPPQGWNPASRGAEAGFAPRNLGQAPSQAGFGGWEGYVENMVQKKMREEEVQRRRAEVEEEKRREAAAAGGGKKDGGKQNQNSGGGGRGKQASNTEAERNGNPNVGEAPAQNANNGKKKNQSQQGNSAEPQQQNSNQGQGGTGNKKPTTLGEDTALHGGLFSMPTPQPVQLPDRWGNAKEQELAELEQLLAGTNIRSAGAGASAQQAGWQRGGGWDPRMYRGGGGNDVFEGHGELGGYGDPAAMGGHGVYGDPTMGGYGDGWGAPGGQW